MAEYSQSPFNKERKDKFVLVIPTPKVLREDVSKTVRNNTLVNPDSMQFSIYGSVIPTVSIPEESVRFSGQTLNVTSYNRPVYDPIEVKFTIDNRFENYWFIYTWLNKLNDEYKGIFDAQNDYQPGFVNEDLYMANFTIYGLDEYNKKVVQFNFSKGFPTKLEGIDYSYRDSEEIESSFTLAYSQFTVNLLTV